MSAPSIEERSSLFEEFRSLRSALAERDYTAAIGEIQQAFNSMMEQNRFRDALILHETILEMLPENSDTSELRLWCLLGIGNAHFHLNHDAEAEVAYTRMRDASIAIEDDYLKGVALVRLGDVARKRGQLEEAEQFYKDSMDTRFKDQDYFGSIEALIFLAITREEAGRWDNANHTLKAVETILRTLCRNISEDASPEYVQACHYWKMALWFQQASLRRAEGNLQQSARILRKALKSLRERDDPRAEAMLLQNLANTLAEQGIHQQAVTLYERSLAIASENSLSETVAAVQLGLAITLFMLKRYTESLPHYEAARDAARRTGNLDRWASLTADVGAVCVEAGEMERGGALLHEALAYFRGKGDLAWQKRILRNHLVFDARQEQDEAFQSHMHECLNLLDQNAYQERGSLYRFAANLYLDPLNDSYGAARCFRQAVAEAEADGDLSQAGQTAALAAAVLSNVGSYSETILLFDRAVEIFTETNDLGNLWRTRNDRGNALAHLGLDDEAIEEYSWCLQTAIGQHDEILEAQAHLNLGEIRRRMGETDAAIFHEERALILYRNVEDREGEADALNALGLCLLDQDRAGGPEDITPYFEQSLQLAKQRRDRLQEAMATRGLAEVADRRGDVSAALRLYERAASLWEREGDYRHCAEALANRVAYIHRLRRGKRQAEITHLIQTAMRAGALEIASRGIIAAGGLLIQAGTWEVAAEMVLLALSLHPDKSSIASVPEELATDLGDILVYIVDAMELWMSREDSARFLDRLTDPANFDRAADGSVLRRTIEAVRSELIARERYIPNPLPTGST